MAMIDYMGSFIWLYKTVLLSLRVWEIVYAENWALQQLTFGTALEAIVWL